MTPRFLVRFSPCLSAADYLDPQALWPLSDEISLGASGGALESLSLCLSVFTRRRAQSFILDPQRFFVRFSPCLSAADYGAESQITDHSFYFGHGSRQMFRTVIYSLLKI